MLFSNNCPFELFKICTTIFSKHTSGMDPDKRNDELARFTAELRVIINNGYYEQFFLMQKILAFADSRKRLVFAGGQYAYSYMTYLLGGVLCNPTGKYEMEMLYDYYHDRKPYPIIYAPFGFIRELAAYLKDLLGDVEVTLSLDEDAICLDGVKWVTVHSDSLITKAEKVLLGEGDIDRAEFERRKRELVDMQIPKVVFADKEYAVSVRSVMEDYASDYDVDYSWRAILIETGDILKALSVIKSRGILESNFSWNEERLYTRDDFLRLGQSLFKSPYDAFRFMTYLRKGRGDSELFRKLLSDNGVEFSPSDMKKLGELKYLVSEGSLIIPAKLIVYLAESENEYGDN